MKRLILVRHAKSDWSEAGLPDRDRKLNARGRDAADRIGRWLAADKLVPDQVLCSSAARCRETWSRISAALSGASEASFEDRLYLAEEAEMLDILHGASGDCLMILGHNPGIGAFARDLRQDPPPLHDAFHKYPTGAVTVLDFNIDKWKDAELGGGRLNVYRTPGDL